MELEFEILKVVFTSWVLTETFALVSGTIDKDFGGDDVTKRKEHLHELSVSELLGQVVDKQVAAFGSWDRASYHINQSTSKHLNLKYNTQVRMLVDFWWTSFQNVECVKNWRWHCMKRCNESDSRFGLMMMLWIMRVIESRDSRSLINSYSGRTIHFQIQNSKYKVFYISKKNKVKI